jgi:TP901 family phage tail tape measure protein
MADYEIGSLRLDTKQAQKDLNDLVKKIGDVGTKSGDEFAKGLGKSSKKIGDVGTKSGDEFAKGLGKSSKKTGDAGTKAGDEFAKGFEKSSDKMSKISQGMKDSFVGAFAGFSAASLVTSALSGIEAAFGESITLAANFQSGMAEVSAITGVTGSALDKMGDSARDLAKKFGTDATEQLDVFKGVLSKLGPQIATVPSALNSITESINTLAKAGGIDAATSMEALSNTLLQFGVDVQNPVTAANEMNRAMNVMAAGAKFGASEIPQISEAVVAAGVAASGANQSIEDVNAQIQILATGGKFGSEAGNALRNVYGLMIKGSGEAGKAFKQLGTSQTEIASILTDPSKGMVEALRKMSGGMAKLGSDAQRAATLSTIFGVENASAAGILLKNADALETMKKNITGTNTATEQAAIIMNTFNERMKVVGSNINDLGITIGQGILKALDWLWTGISNLVDGFKEFLKTIDPVIQFIKNQANDVINSFVDVFKSLYDIFIDLLPLIKLSIGSALAPLIGTLTLLVGGLTLLAKVLKIVVVPVLQWFADILTKYVAPVLKTVSDTIINTGEKILKFFHIIESKPKTAPLAKGIKDIGDIANVATAPISGLNQELSETGTVVKDGKSALEKLEEQLKKLQTSYENLAVAQTKDTTEDRAAAMGKLSEKMKPISAQIDKVKKQMESLDAILHPEKAMEEAKKDLEEIAKLRDADTKLAKEQAKNAEDLFNKEEESRLKRKAAAEVQAIKFPSVIMPEEPDNWLVKFYQDAKTSAEDFFSFNANAQQQYDEAQKALAADNDENTKSVAQAKMDMAQKDLDQQQALANASIDIGAKAASILLDQTKTSGQKSLILAADIAEKMLAIYAVKIIAMFTEAIPIPFVGTATGVAVVAGLMAMFEVAKAKIGAQEGVVGIDEHYNKPAGAKDRINLWVAKGEAISNEYAVNAKGRLVSNREMLEFANKTHRPMEELVMQKMPYTKTQSPNTVIIDNRELINEIQSLKKEVRILKNAAIHTAETNDKMSKDKPTINNKIEVKNDYWR